MDDFLPGSVVVTLRERNAHAGNLCLRGLSTIKQLENMKITRTADYEYRTYMTEDGKSVRIAIRWRTRGTRRRQKYAKLLRKWRSAKAADGGPNCRYEVHYPSSRNYGSGPNEWERTIETIITDDVVPSRTLDQGPVKINGMRKLRCNIQDRKLGIWVRVDYSQLVEDGMDSIGRVIKYSIAEGKCEQIEYQADFARHRYSHKLINKNQRASSNEEILGDEMRRTR